ncbi:hypothetical protein BDP27DRAFT_1360507 [Rhodocollybia butyracea]|uniref:Uncharacterized protein n=1 Tax=Rhodocollybia butyracea TaxID=206335 RepID=A0A9P5Q1E9_9AGAR|nr:hypothetical protein BDP27DRAFT_1360507 [Rhodocollybia butyracea]
MYSFDQRLEEKKKVLCESPLLSSSITIPKGETQPWALATDPHQSGGNAPALIDRNLKPAQEFSVPPIKTFLIKPPLTSPSIPPPNPILLVIVPARKSPTPTMARMQGMGKLSAVNKAKTFPKRACTAAEAIMPLHSPTLEGSTAAEAVVPPTLDEEHLAPTTDATATSGEELAVLREGWKLIKDYLGDGVCAAVVFDFIATVVDPIVKANLTKGFSSAMSCKDSESCACIKAMIVLLTQNINKLPKQNITPPSNQSLPLLLRILPRNLLQILPLHPSVQKVFGVPDGLQGVLGMSIAQHVKPIIQDFMKFWQQEAEGKKAKLALSEGLSLYANDNDYNAKKNLAPIHEEDLVRFVAWDKCMDTAFIWRSWLTDAAVIIDKHDMDIAEECNIRIVIQEPQDGDEPLVLAKVLHLKKFLEKADACKVKIKDKQHKSDLDEQGPTLPTRLRKGKSSMTRILILMSPPLFPLPHGKKNPLLPPPNEQTSL